MPLNKPGKRITTQKISKIPKVSAYTAIKQYNRVDKNYQGSLKSRVNPLFGGDTFPDDKLLDFGNKNNAEAFSIWLRDNAVTTIDTGIFGTGTKTSISINPPTNTGGSDYLIRKGDTFYIYDQFSYKKIKLIADADLLHGSTSLAITSTSFVKGKNLFRSGSYVIADNKVLVERVSNTPLLKRFNLTNAEYKLLLTTPYTLLAAETGKLHIPLNATIIYTHGADEMVSADLYIGHDASSTTIGNYWGSINEFAYRKRNNLLYQMGASTYGAGLSANFSSIPLKQDRDDGTGDALKLYTSANFASPTSTITVLLYYKTILI